MNIAFYSQMSSENTVFKFGLNESYPALATLEGVLKDDCSVERPVIMIENTRDSHGSSLIDITHFNYAYIPDFGRYYYVDDIVFVTNNMLEVHLKVDVLHSFRKFICSAVGIVERTSDFTIDDSNLNRYNNGQFRSVSLPNDLRTYGFHLETAASFHDYDNGRNILVTSGGTLDDSFGMMNIYNPNDAQMKTFADWLYNFDFTDLFDQYWRLWRNPMDSIISFQRVFFDVNTGSSAPIMLGNKRAILEGATIFAKTISKMNPLTTITFSISVSEISENYRYRPPYSSATLYLPFIGMVPIDVNDFLNTRSGGDPRTLYVTYRCDPITGALYCAVTVSSGGNMHPIGTYGGNAAQTLPITASDSGQALTNTISSIGKIAVGSYTGSSGLVTSGANQLMGTRAQEQVLGTITGNTGALGPLSPVLHITTSAFHIPTDYEEFLGKSIYEKKKVTDCTGFTKFVEIETLDFGSSPTIPLGSTIYPTIQERHEIEEALKNGVNLPDSWS